MASPFPGFDPYLEAPDIWPDFHNALAGEIRRELNRLLPRPYYARLEMRPEIGILNEEGADHLLVPDVSVAEGVAARPREPETTAVLERPRTEISPAVEISVPFEPVRHSYVEIRDSVRGHGLITLIEIVSPSNKQAGPDRRAYLAKQHEVLDSEASLVEIDLLREGERLFPSSQVASIVAQLQPSPNYLVLVNRAWRRMGGTLGCQLFAISLRKRLPVISIPLREQEQEIPLDLQWLFNATYDSGPYSRGAIDYREAARPALTPADTAWAAERVRA